MLKTTSKNKTIFCVTMILTSVLLVTSCGDNSSQNKLDKYISDLKNKRSVKNLPNELFKIPDKMLYHPEKTRSPFDTNQFISEIKSTNPLERYSLSMLHFVGTLMDNATTYAYILAPDNKIYPVKLGEKIGDHDGIITGIDVDRIEVTENVNEAGKPATKRIITLQLKDKL